MKILWSVECKKCASDMNMLVAIHGVLKVKCKECGCTEVNTIFKERNKEEWNEPTTRN